MTRPGRPVEQQSTSVLAPHGPTRVSTASPLGSSGEHSCRRGAPRASRPISRARIPEVHVVEKATEVLTIATGRACVLATDCAEKRHALFCAAAPFKVEMEGSKSSVSISAERFESSVGGEVA